MVGASRKGNATEQASSSPLCLTVLPSDHYHHQATNIKLFTGNSCPDLAENVAKSLLLEMSAVTVRARPPSFFSPFFPHHLHSRAKSQHHTIAQQPNAMGEKGYAPSVFWGGTYVLCASHVAIPTSSGFGMCVTVAVF
jgi:hypothetical protein